jgi:hypothetical protein
MQAEGLAILVVVRFPLGQWVKSVGGLAILVVVQFPLGRWVKSVEGLGVLSTDSIVGLTGYLEFAIEQPMSTKNTTLKAIAATLIIWIAILFF